MNPSAKQTVKHTVSGLLKQSESESQSDVRTTSLKPAVPLTSPKDVTGEIANWEAEADRIHAYHHHHQAAQYHEREAEWNAGWARWHRAEMARLEGEG